MVNVNQLPLLTPLEKLMSRESVVLEGDHATKASWKGGGLTLPLVVDKTRLIVLDNRATQRMGTEVTKPTLILTFSAFHQSFALQSACSSS